MAAPASDPKWLHEGHRTPQPEAEAQYERMTLTAEIEEDLHRRGASTEMLELLKEIDADLQLPAAPAGQLGGEIRAKALRCISHMLQGCSSGHCSWFQAALLLDRLTASNDYRLEQLPLACVCVARLVIKCACSVATPLTSESPQMHMIKEFSTWLESTQDCLASEVSNRALNLHEKTVLKALDWQAEVPCVEQWCRIYFTRFGRLAGREYQAPLQQMHGTALMFARAVVMCVPASAELSHGKLATGLFSLSFVYSSLLPMALLKPETMADAEWSALFAATQPRGELPTCRLPKLLTLGRPLGLFVLKRIISRNLLRRGFRDPKLETLNPKGHPRTMRIMDMICLTVKEELDVIRAQAARMLEALGETFQQIHCFHVQGAGNR